MVCIEIRDYSYVIIVMVCMQVYSVWDYSCRWVVWFSWRRTRRLSTHGSKWNESGFRPPLCTYRLNWTHGSMGHCDGWVMIWTSTRICLSIGIMLRQRRRRWLNIIPILSSTHRVWCDLFSRLMNTNTEPESQTPGLHGNGTVPMLHSNSKQQ